MFKRTLRWLMPLIALLMLIAWLTFAPILSSHAASITPNAPTQISAPAIQSHHTLGPDIIYWRP